MRKGKGYAGKASRLRTGRPESRGSVLRDPRVHAPMAHPVHPLHLASRESHGPWQYPRGRDQVVVHWSRKEVGMNPTGACAAWVALHRLTGEIPVVHRSRASVAAWRMREGERTGVSVTRRGAKSTRLRRSVLTHLNEGALETMEAHQDRTHTRCTFTVEKPRRRPTLESHYELLRTRIRVPGLSVTVTLQGGSANAGEESRAPGYTRRMRLLRERAA